MVTFSAAASGSPAPTVQWQVSTNHGGSYVNIPGANSTSLTFQVGAWENGYLFRAVFTNGAGQVATSAAKLMVSGISSKQAVDLILSSTELTDWFD
jgi:hypothetical protein